MLHRGRTLAAIAVSSALKACDSTLSVRARDNRSFVGRFIVDPEKRLEIIAPDLAGFKVSPRTSRSVILGP